MRAEISEIYEELGETIYSVYHDDLLQLVCSKVDYYGIISKDVREELRLVTEQVKLVADTFCDFTVENPYAELEEMLPDFKEEVKVLKNYGEAIDELSTDAELVASYTREFRKIVDQAQIPEKSKELIIQQWWLVVIALFYGVLKMVRQPEESIRIN